MSFNLLPEESILACSLTFAYFLFSSHSPESWHCFSGWSIAWKLNFWTFLLNNSKFNTWCFWVCQVKLFINFDPTLLRQSKGSRWISRRWDLLGAASALFSPPEHQGPDSRVQSQAVQEGRGFASKLGMRNTSQVSISQPVTLGGTDCSLGTGIQLWKEPRETKERGHKWAECSGVRRKK